MNKKRDFSFLILQGANFCLLAFLFVFSFGITNDLFASSNWSTTISIISIGIAIYQFSVFRRIGISFYDFRFWFMALTYIFLFGQVWIIALGKSEQLFYPIIFRFPNHSLFFAGLFALCYTHAVFIGLLFRKKGNTLPMFIKKIENEETLNHLLFKTGLLLVIVSIPFRLYLDISQVLFTRSLGFYSNAPLPIGPAKDMAILIIPGILSIICSKRISKRINLYFIVLVVFYLLLIMLYSGDRRYYVTAILALVLCYLQTSEKKIKPLNLFAIGSLSLLILNLLAIIRYSRKEALLSFAIVAKYHWPRLFSLNFIFETLNEFGVTFLTIVSSVQLIPSTIPFQYGLSFWGTIPSILPIGWLFRDFFKEVSVLNVLNSITGLPLGSSFPAELYANFGWFGIIGAILGGTVLSNIMPIIGRRKTNKYLIMKHYSLLFILINVVRASALEVFRQSLIIFFVPTIALYFFAAHRKKKSI